MAKDILLDADRDLLFIEGDFNIGNSDEQHVEDILLSSKGEYKQFPLIGIDLLSFINSSLTLNTRQKLEKEISIQLLSDNANEIKVTTDNEGGIKVEARYE
tara:strand:- start:160 stop:462 length:303 start_codon:yes stop_codon:yes gene_type:complete